MAGRRALPAIASVLENDVEEVQMDAAFALGWFGDPEYRPLLEKAAQGSSELVSFFAKEALENIEHAEKMRRKNQGS